MPVAPVTELIEFVLDQATSQPLAKRVSLYRATSTIAPDENTSLQLRNMADELETVEEQHQQLHLDFQLRLGRR